MHDREKQSLAEAEPPSLAEAESILADLASVFFPSDSASAAEPEPAAALARRPNLETRYRTLVEQIPAVVFMAFLDNGIGEAYVSPQIEALLGFTQEEWLNDPVRWYWQIYPDDRGRWNIEAAQMFLSGQPLKSVYRVMADDGHVVWFRCEARMVRREDGRPWFIHGVAFDITDLKQVEQALQHAHDELEARVATRTAELAKANRDLQSEIAERRRAEEERTLLLAREQAARAEAERANRLKDEFLATVSHELRTPLNAILGWSHMLRTGRLDEAIMGRALETIERNAKAQAQLIEDLLDIARITSGKLRLDAQPLELAPVVEAAIESMRPAADAKGIRLVSVLDPQAGLVSGDAGRLQQVIWNLLSNAVKFTLKGGRVQIRLECVNSYVEISVSDTGEGISQEFLPYVFERFRQADSSLTRPYAGLGLGLAIVRHLIEMHGGIVWADSPGPGQGATFTVQLPLISGHAVNHLPTQERLHPTAEDHLPLANSTALTGLRVLVVDDEDDTLEMLAAVLRQCGAEVKAAASAAQAMEILAAWQADVLVSDISMPGEDGYTLIGKVRALERQQGRRVAAVALTAHARATDRMKALSSGFQMHVPKPVEPAELIVVIASLTGHRSGKR